MPSSTRIRIFVQCNKLLQRDGAPINTALRIFLRVVQHSLVEHCPGAARSGKAVQRIGAVAFITVLVAT